MRIPSRWIVPAALLLPGALAAQAPVITAAGDPSVSSDSIYALVVDPADHAEESVVLLLDDGVVVQEADGTGRRTYRMVAQILDRDAVDVWSEHTFGYDGGRESFELNWARVVRPDGSVVSEEPIHVQEMDLPVPEQSPVFTSWKQVRVSLGGVEPGTLVDYSYTVTTAEPARPGDFVSNWNVTTGGTVRRSRFLVDVPAGYDLRIDATEPTGEPKVTTSGGRDVYEWYDEDLAWIEPEYFPALEESSVYKRVRVGAPGDWRDIGAWYLDLSRDRYAVTDELRQAAAAEIGDREGLDALRALHRWVAQDFRYVSISLGQGSYRPRLPAEVLASRSGDCKDKATLFIALARELGFDAHPVLLNSTGGVSEALPSVQQFDHVIAAVDVEGEWVYLDLTAAIIPFGEISPSYQGEFGLVAKDDGSVEEVTFPESAPEDNVSSVLVEGEISPDGGFEGRYLESQEGGMQYQLRSAFARSFTQRELDQMANAIAGDVLVGGRGSGLEIFDGLDLDADVRLSLDLSTSQATRPNVGGGWIFTLPIANYANQALVTGLEDELDTRKLPLDVDQVSGRNTTVQELRITLPEGWTARLPEDVAVESRFGRYEARYRQSGRDLHVVRRFVGATGTEPAASLPDLIAFLREMGRDDVPFLLLETTGPSAGEAGPKG